MIAQFLYPSDGSAQLNAPQFGHQHGLDQRVLARHAVRFRHLAGAVPYIHLFDLGALHGF